MKIELNIEYFEENNTIVALCPELQVSSFGDTLEKAEKSIKEALELFFEGCNSKGTINDVLERMDIYPTNRILSDSDKKPKPHLYSGLFDCFILSYDKYTRIFIQ